MLMRLWDSESEKFVAHKLKDQKEYDGLLRKVSPAQSSRMNKDKGADRPMEQWATKSGSPLNSLGLGSLRPGMEKDGSGTGCSTVWTDCSPSRANP